VIKSSRASWSLPEGVALPVAMTGFNTLVLFASGVMLWYCGRLVQDKDPHGKARTVLALAMGLGAFFVMVQGYEWIQLISYGLTMRSSIFGACFFLLVGSHALHALAGILAMVYLFAKSSSTLRLADCRAVQVFWFFVVGIWPLLYYLVYFEAVR
jgi:cytochrome c oxidase subunit III